MSSIRSVNRLNIIGKELIRKLILGQRTLVIIEAIVEQNPLRISCKFETSVPRSNNLAGYIAPIGYDSSAYINFELSVIESLDIRLYIIFESLIYVNADSAITA